MLKTAARSDLPAERVSQGSSDASEPSATAVGEPPAPGNSGTAPGDAPATPATTAKGCAISVAPPGTDDSGGSLVWAQAAGCTGDQIILVVNGNNHEVDVGLRGPDFTYPYNTDPCALNAAPTQALTVTYTMKVTSGPDASMTSAPYTGKTTPGPSTDVPPNALVVGSPPDGSLVHPGSNISLAVTGIDDIGVTAITVTADPGGTLANRQFTPRVQPSACHPTQDREQLKKVHYRVPADVGNEVIFTVSVTDTAGHQQTVALEYPTKIVWAGNLHAIGRGSVPGDSCQTTWNLDFRVTLGPKNAVTGEGVAHDNGIQGCRFVTGGARVGGTISFKVTGTYDGKTFTLQFVPTSIIAQIDWGITGLHLLATPSPMTIEVKQASSIRHADGTVDRDNAGNVENSVGTASLHGFVNMDCCYPNAGPSDSPTSAPTPGFQGGDDPPANPDHGLLPPGVAQG